MPRTDAELKVIRASADKHAEAILEASRSMTALWRSQMDLAISSGDDAVLNDVLTKTETGLWDNNTNCPCGGGETARW